MIRTTKNCYNTRYEFALLGCFGIMIIYAMRVNLSLAMVVMVNTTIIHKKSNTTNECIMFRSKNETDMVQVKALEFNWDESIQSLIFGSFFWGYVVSQIPGGRLADKYSAKWLFGLSVLGSSFLYVLIPFAARTNYWYLVGVRVLGGILEGPTFPTIQAMLVNWSPPTERSRITAIVYSGSSLGTVISLPLSGVLITSGFDGGWPSTFYVCGSAGIIWSILWLFIIHDNPSNHPWISDKEKAYIKNSTGKQGEQRSAKPPWLAVFTSLPMWAIIVAHFCHNWGGYTLLTELPMFLETILQFDIKKNSLMSALPNLTSWIFSVVCSLICDFLLKKEWLTTSKTRKLFHFIGHAIPAFIFFSMTLVQCNQTIILTLLILAMTINGAAYTGFLCNHIDIAPSYAATLMGVTNTIATIPGWMGPFVVGQLINGYPTTDQWNKVFYITGALYLFSALFFAVFAKGKEQPWNKMVSNYNVNITNKHDDHAKLSSPVLITEAVFTSEFSGNTTGGASIYSIPIREKIESSDTVTSDSSNYACYKNLSFVCETGITLEIKEPNDFDISKEPAEISDCDNEDDNETTSSL